MYTVLLPVRQNDRKPFKNNILAFYDSTKKIQNFKIRKIKNDGFGDETMKLRNGLHIIGK